MTQPTAYNLLDYGWMLDSRMRTDPYVEALRRVVRSGDVVFDIGAGPGIFAILACRLGAKYAVAIETDDSVQLARDFALAEGCSDRIEIFQGMSTRFDPVEKADVIVADVRGSLPLFEHGIASLIDARTRLLKPGGILIPRKDRLWLALIESKKAYRKFERPWLKNRYGLNLAAGVRFVVNEFQPHRFRPSNFLGEPAVLREIDYLTVSGPNMEMPFELKTTRTGTVHGLAIWFDTDLYDGIGYSAAPGQKRGVYGQGFFPLKIATDVREGELVKGEIIARLGTQGYTWSWRTQFPEQGPGGKEFRQSTAFATTFSPGVIAGRSSGHVPRVSERIEVDRFCLERIDGTKTLSAIAGELQCRFPGHFSDENQAFDHVCALVGRYERAL